jgi:hypothetical protein
MTAAAFAMAAIFAAGFMLRPRAVDPAPPPPPAPPVMREVPVEVAPPEEDQIMPLDTPAPAAEPAAIPTPDAAAASLAPIASFAALDAADWDARVGDARAVWVSVGEQRFRVMDGRTVVWETACATAENGVGSEARSLKTPLGWHTVAEKFGDGAVWGQVFRSRMPTKEVWKHGGDVKEDLVLTRVLWLDGLEPGKNKGKNAAGTNVDSKERCIYIHGTNAEEKLGVASSHGCIRLSNDDVIEAFEILSIGTLVLITE